MTAEQNPEPPSKLSVFAVHAAVAMPLNAVAVPLAFGGAIALREALSGQARIFDEKGFFAVFAVLIAGVMFSALIQGATIMSGAGRRRGIAWGPLLIYPLGFILTVLACDWLFDSPQLALLDAAEASVREHGFFFVRSIERTLPHSGLQRLLMMLVLSPVFLVVGLFDILLMPFVPLTDPNFYIALLKLIPYFCVLLLGSALPSWLLARRLRAKAV